MSTDDNTHGKKKPPPTSRIEQTAKKLRRKRSEWKKHPVLKTVGLGERGVKYLGRGVRAAGHLGAATGRFAHSYGQAYSHGRGQSLARWARNRRAWLARHVEVDTSHMARALQPGMTGRRRALYATAVTRRTVQQRRRHAAQRLTRTAGALAVSTSPLARGLHRPVQHTADRVHPGSYRCPRCGATYRNTRAWTRHECVTPHGVTRTRQWVPDNPDNPTHHTRNQPPKPAGTLTPKSGQSPQPPPGRGPARTLGEQPPKPPPKPATETPKPATTEAKPMSNNTSGGHPAQIIGKGGVNLGGLHVSTDTELIWTLERLSAASQMVGNGSLAFAEHLDALGVDPRVVEPVKGYAQHMAEGAGFPLSAHRMFWALYGHRIQPTQGSARAVKADRFFGDQR